MTATCKTCHASIVWVKTPAGKSMPLDAVMTTDGTLEIRAGVARNVGTTKRPDQLLYVPHWATCKQAAEHRRPRT